MKTEGPNIHFDKFATEDLWALSSLRALLFDEYRITQDINKLPKVVVSLLLQFDRHMVAAEAAGKITIVKHTSTAFAGIEEPLFHSQQLLKELNFSKFFQNYLLRCWVITLIHFLWRMKLVLTNLLVQITLVLSCHTTLISERSLFMEEVMRFNAM